MDERGAAPHPPAQTRQVPTPRYPEIVLPHGDVVRICPEGEQRARAAIEILLRVARRLADERAAATAPPQAP